MKMILKTGYTALLLLGAIACTKQNLNSPGCQLPTAVKEAAYSSAQTAAHFIGKSFGGGTIFYLDVSGKHGLIAAPQVVSAMNIYVGNLSLWVRGDAYPGDDGPIYRPRNMYISTGATGLMIGEGSDNTRKILAAQGGGEHAAGLCVKYNGSGYTDWFLPSKNELRELYAQKSAIKGFDCTGSYWSSTEASDEYAWVENFGSGEQAIMHKSLSFKVCPVRAF